MQGDATGWSRIEQTSVNLLPDGRQVVGVVFAPPRSPSVRAGVHEFGVSVRSSEHPNDGVIERGQVQVAEFIDYSAELVPQIARAKDAAAVDVKVTNGSNVDLRVGFAASDPEGALRFSLPYSLDLEPGASAARHMRVSAPTGGVVGVSRTWPFNVVVTTSGNRRHVVEGTFVQAIPRPRWPAYWPAIAGATIVAAAGTAWVLAGNRPQLGAERTPPQSVTVPATPTAEPRATTATETGPALTPPAPTAAATPSTPVPPPTPTPVVVDRYECLHLADATTRATNQGLKIEWQPGSVIDDASWVTAQNPPPGTRVSPGSLIQLSAAAKDARCLIHP
jgi:hypothetical protein